MLGCSNISFLGFWRCWVFDSKKHDRSASISLLRFKWIYLQVDIECPGDLQAEQLRNSWWLRVFSFVFPVNNKSSFISQNISLSLRNALVYSTSRNKSRGSFLLSKFSKKSLFFCCCFKLKNYFIQEDNCYFENRRFFVASCEWFPWLSS